MIADILKLIAERSSRGIDDMSEELLPPPPPPTVDATLKKQVFAEVVIWLQDNFAFLGKGQKHGSGFVVPIRTRMVEMTRYRRLPR